MENDEAKFIRNRKILAIVTPFVLIAIIIIAIIVSHFNSLREKVIVSGLTDCLIDITNEDRDKVYRMVFDRANAHNEINGKEKKDSYNAVIRDGSCHNERIESEGQEFQSANFIVDIEELQYSYRVRFNYIPKNTKINGDSYVDLGTVDVYCLDKDEMIYPDFGCEKDSMTLQEPDPITKIVGNLFDGCSINYTTSGTSNSGYAIVLTYSPSEEVYQNGTYGDFKTTCHNKAMKLIQDSGINLDDYYFYEKE